jgi:hypothetical protein
MSRAITAAAAVLVAGAALAASPVYAATTQPAAVPAAVAPATSSDHTMPAEVKFTASSLSDVISFLADASGANFSVDWKALEAANVTKDTPITLHMTTAVPLRKVLQLVLQQAGGAGTLTYYVDDGVIQITSQEQEDKQMVTKTYPIQDLLFQATDYNDAPTLSLQQQQQTGGGGAGGGGGGGGNNSSSQLFTQTTTTDTNKAAKSGTERADEIIKLITDTIRPEIWQVNGGTATINYFRGSLIVHAPRSVQAQLSSR